MVCPHKYLKFFFLFIRTVCVCVFLISLKVYKLKFLGWMTLLERWILLENSISILGNDIHSGKHNFTWLSEGWICMFFLFPLFFSFSLCRGIQQHTSINVFTYTIWQMCVDGKKLKNIQFSMNECKKWERRQFFGDIHMWEGGEKGNKKFGEAFYRRHMNTFPPLPSSHTIKSRVSLCTLILFNVTVSFWLFTLQHLPSYTLLCDAVNVNEGWQKVKDEFWFVRLVCLCFSSAAT